MAQVPEKPIVGQIVDSIVKALKDANKEAGTEYHHATDDVIPAPGVSPKWFEDATWNHLYWVVVPEELPRPITNKHFRSLLEVFIVGAKKGRWLDDPKKNDLIRPRKEDVQYEIAADIKRAVLVDFRRAGLAHNTDLTSARFSFDFWFGFAIVTTRWEVEFDWPFMRP